jgi:nitroreductase
MSIVNSLKERRSYYNISKNLPVDENKVIKLVEEATEFTPDAFNMKSARVVVVLGEQHDKLWDSIFDVFGGKVPREKIDSFKAGAGTILYFYDNSVVKGLQEKFPAYANNFPVWANQANGMLQSNIWVGLRELGIGASLQHYNPVIDDVVKKLFEVPENYILVAQMPFGGIVEEPTKKDIENISERIVVKK